MNIVWIIVIGFVVGVLAKFVLPGRGPGGLFITAAIGIAGSLIATYGGQAIGIYQPSESTGFIGALVGAVILLILYRQFVRND